MVGYDEIYCSTFMHPFYSTVGYNFKNALDSLILMTKVIFTIIKKIRYSLTLTLYPHVKQQRSFCSSSCWSASSFLKRMKHSKLLQTCLAWRIIDSEILWKLFSADISWVALSISAALELYILHCVNSWLTVIFMGRLYHSTLRCKLSRF